MVYMAPMGAAAEAGKGAIIRMQLIPPPTLVWLLGALGEGEVVEEALSTERLTIPAGRVAMGFTGL